ncbi:Nuclear cap-binding protein subunit 1 [Zalaria obscura]|uniref:Nuclear cap-binding protein subunit 1 n=1 Tax=Zalaria obscura TaxID=2024903 RepID=A0ACC3SIT3_9PEZI
MRQPYGKPEEEVTNIAKIVTENYEDEYVRNTFGELVVALISEQPFKIPFVAAVVLFANNDKAEVAQDILTRVANHAQAHLEAGNWRELKLALRFLAFLQGLYNDDGVFPVLEELFNRAVDLQTASSEDVSAALEGSSQSCMLILSQVLGLELVKIILLTIPYVLASSATGLEQKVAELLEKTDIVASTPHTLEPLVDPYSSAEEDQKPMACPSLINILQKQLQNESSNGWQLSCIPRLYKEENTAMAGTEENAESEPKVPSKHSFPTINVPSSVKQGPRTLFPELYFSLFADQDIEVRQAVGSSEDIAKRSKQSVPPTSDVAASLLRDAIVDTINILDYNRNATAKFMIEIDCYWTVGTFVKRATPFDKLKDVPEGRSTWKPEDIIVDAVFSQILQLPAPEHKLIYYHSIITESCKIAPAAVAPSLGRAIRFLYRSLDVMDLELSYRYMDWFAHHLSNFEFRWKWTEWIDDIDQSDLAPRKAFITGALDKEIRLSFAKRIRETLPEVYSVLIPEGKLKDTPDFKFDDDQTPYAQQGREVHKLLRKKAPEEEIQTVLDEIQKLATEQGVEDPLIPSTDAYMTSVCAIGSKSLSHVLSCIERCKERLLAVGPQSEPARRQIISSVVEYWGDHPGVAVNIIDKLLNYTIITPMSVIEWALHDHLNHGRDLSKSYVYEMVATTMFKVTNRVRQVVVMRNDPATPAEQRPLLDQTLTTERQSMRELFAAIEDAVTSVASSANDEMIERFDGEEVEQALIRAWGERWARAWRRKAAVEEAVVGEAVVEAAAAALDAQASAEAGADGNGVDEAQASAEMDQVE